MARRFTTEMNPAEYKIIGNILHDRYYGVSRKIRDAQDYQISRLKGKEEFIRDIEMSLALGGIIGKDYYIVSSIDSCILIIPGISKETAERFRNDLNHYAGGDICSLVDGIEIYDDFLYYFLGAEKFKNLKGHYQNAFFEIFN